MWLVSEWKTESESDFMGFPGGPVVKKPAASAGDMHLIPGSGGFLKPQGN